MNLFDQMLSRYEIITDNDFRNANVLVVARLLEALTRIQYSTKQLILMTVVAQQNTYLKCRGMAEKQRRIITKTSRHPGVTPPDTRVSQGLTPGCQR